MYEILAKNMTVWMDVVGLNARTPPLLEPTRYVAHVNPKRYRLKKPKDGRIVQRAPMQGVLQLAGYVPPPHETLDDQVWSVAGADADESSDPAKNFVWLPYWPGYITYMDLVPGRTVVTGRMSGCLLALFRMGGRRYFCHIGTTDLPLDETTIRVKNAWKLMANTCGAVLESQFSPSAKVKRGANETFGVLTSGGAFASFHTLALGNSRFKIIGKNDNKGSMMLPRDFYSAY